METGTIIVLVVIFALCIAFGGGNVFKDKGGQSGGSGNSSNSNSSNSNGSGS